MLGSSSSITIHKVLPIRVVTVICPGRPFSSARQLAAPETHSLQSCSNHLPTEAPSEWVPEQDTITLLKENLNQDRHFGTGSFLRRLDGEAVNVSKNTHRLHAQLL